MVNHRVDASHGETRSENRSIRGIVSFPSGTESRWGKLFRRAFGEGHRAPPRSFSPRVAVGLLHRHRAFRSAIQFRRLPQLDPVPFGIADPSEPAVLRVLDVAIDVDALGAQRFAEPVQVLHAVVDHERRAVLAEVLRVRGEDRPDRVAVRLAVLPAPPREEGDGVLDGYPEMVPVPFGHPGRILRLEEDASDSRDAGPTRSRGHAARDAFRRYRKSVRGSHWSGTSKSGSGAAGSPGGGSAGRVTAWDPSATGAGVGMETGIRGRFRRRMIRATAPIAASKISISPPRRTTSGKSPPAPLPTTLTWRLRHA